MAYLEKIEFNNFAPPGISEEILEALQDNIENAISKAVNGVELFQNLTGTTGDVNLNADPNQFSRIRITLGKEQIGITSIEIPRELFNKCINITQAQEVGATIQLVEKRYIIDGTYLRVFGTPSYINFTNRVITEQGAENSINIYRVVGLY